MSTRGDLTRRKILESARILFAEKGYTAVTMEDVRLCCGLSRGGLYRHYSSTQEIFTQLIEDEQKAAFAALAKAIQDKIPAAQMLETFLKNRIKHLFNPQTCLECICRKCSARQHTHRQAGRRFHKHPNSNSLARLPTTSFFLQKLPLCRATHFVPFGRNGQA